MRLQQKQRSDGVIISHDKDERDAIGGAMGRHAEKQDAYTVDEAMCYAGQFLAQIDPDVILIIVDEKIGLLNAYGQEVLTHEFWWREHGIWLYDHWVPRRQIIGADIDR